MDAQCSTSTTSTMAKAFVLLLSLCLLSQINCGRAYEGFTRSEKLAEDYILEWTVDSEHNKIEFLVRVLSLGYVGFGINPTQGAMDGADMIIGGVYDNGTSYLTDGHGVGHQFVKDKSQDWILLDAFESDGWTTLKLERPLQTCDQEDVQITEETLRVIYSYGKTDQAEHHEDNRGVQSLQLLNPTSRLGEDTSSFSSFDVSVEMELPGDSTVYWESVHCFPNFKSKVHIVGVEAILPTTEAQKHVHHMLGYRCTTPEDPSEAANLQALSNTTGGMLNDPSLQVASRYCNEFIFGWSIGGYPVFFPDDVGLPFGRRDNPECVRLQTHIHNPENVTGLKFETGFKLYYTKELRKYDGGGLTLGTMTVPHLIVPPAMKEFVHTGHCSSTCTSASLPQGGVKVFGISLHTHTHGKKVKVRHFRGKTELPWIVADDHYDFNYQQYNPLREHVQLLPGDQLTAECVYETAEATHQGPSTEQEMCTVFLGVYPDIPNLSLCMSAFWPPEEVLNPLGIGSLNSSDQLNPIVTSPLEMKGLTLLDVLNYKVNWTAEKIEMLQDQMRWKKQMGMCKGEQSANLVPGVSYPMNFQAYEPKLTCQKKSSGAETALMVGSLLPMAISVAILVGRWIAYI